MVQQPLMECRQATLQLLTQAKEATLHILFHTSMLLICIQLLLRMAIQLLLDSCHMVIISIHNILRQEILA